MLDRILELCNTIKTEEENLNSKRKEVAAEINRLLQKCYLRKEDEHWITVLHIDKIEVIEEGLEVYGLSLEYNKEKEASIENCITYISFNELASDWKLCELRRFKETWDYIHEIFYEKLPKGFN